MLDACGRLKIGKKGQFMEWQNVCPRCRTVVKAIPGSQRTPMHGEGICPAIGIEELTQIQKLTLTEKQVEALRHLRKDGPTSPFHFGSTTVNRLRKLGLVEN